MKKYIYLFFSFFFILFLLVIMAYVTFSTSLEFQNDIIPENSIILNISEITDTQSFKSTAEKIVSENKLYLSRIEFSKINNQVVKTYYINDPSIVKNVHYFDDNQKLINEKYIGTTKVKGVNQIGFKQGYNKMNTKIMDFSSNINQLSLKGQYYIYSENLTAEEYENILKPLNQYSEYDIIGNIQSYYSITNDIGLVIILVLLFMTMLYVLILFEKGKMRKLIIKLIYGSTLRSLAIKEYVNISIGLNIIAVILIMLFNFLFKLTILKFIIYSFVSLLVINIVIFIIIYLFVLNLENKNLINYIKNVSTYKLKKLDYIIKFILSILLIFIISLILYNIVGLEKNLYDMNKYWNLNGEYLKADGFDLGEDGYDFDKIDLQFQALVNELQKNGAIYISYNSDENVLYVSKEYFELNPIYLSTGEKYKYTMNNKEDILISSKFKDDDDYIKKQEDMYDVYFYDEGVEFPTYDINLSVLKDPEVIVRDRDISNNVYVTHTLIPIIKDEQTTKEYYYKILEESDADDNLTNINTIDDEIIMKKREVLIQSSILMFVTIVFMLLYSLIQAYIIKIYILSNKKKIGIYKMYEIPRKKIYLKLYKNTIISYFIIFTILFTITIVFGFSLYIWLSFIILSIFEIIIIKIYVKLEENKRILEIMKGE